MTNQRETGHAEQVYLRPEGLIPTSSGCYLGRVRAREGRVTFSWKSGFSSPRTDPYPAANGAPPKPVLCAEQVYLSAQGLDPSSWGSDRGRVGPRAAILGPKWSTDEIFGPVMQRCAESDPALSDQLFAPCKFDLLRQSGLCRLGGPAGAARGPLSPGPRAGARKQGQGVALARFGDVQAGANRPRRASLLKSPRADSHVFRVLPE